MTFKKGYIELICILTALLFVYAASSKVLDFQNFKIQLGQSPIIAIWAVPVAIGIPLCELIIAIFLLFPQRRKWALWCAFTLMIMFTCYIYIILNYSTYIPCSCGGVLEKMSWSQHLYFNAITAFLIAVAFTINNQKKQINQS